jgi:hypothetical protein
MLKKDANLDTFSGSWSCSSEASGCHIYMISLPRQRWADHYFGPMVRWSAAQRTTEMIAEQRTGKNTKVSFRYSAVRHFLAYLKNISKRRNYQIMGVDTDTNTAE